MINQPDLPKESIHEPTSHSPSPSKGLKQLSKGIESETFKDNASAMVGLREDIAHEFSLFMVDEYDAKRIDQTVGELHASLQRLELEFADRVMALFHADKSAAVVEAELRGLSLIENAPRVPVELMSMVIERRKELKDE